MPPDSTTPIPQVDLFTCDPTLVKIHIQSCIAALRDEHGRSKSGELSMAVIKLREAVMWIDEHLRLS